LDEDARQWEETNRRDKWDRTYKKRLRNCKEQPNNTGAMDALNAEYEEEQARRRDWDTKDQRSQNLSSLSVSASPTGLPMASSEPNTRPSGLMNPSTSSSGIVSLPPNAVPSNQDSFIATGIDGRSIAGSNIHAKDSVASASPAGDSGKSKRDVLKSIFGKRRSN
jgi:hypothetical protein